MRVSDIRAAPWLGRLRDLFRDGISILEAVDYGPSGYLVDRIKFLENRIDHLEKSLEPRVVSLVSGEAAAEQ